MTYDERVAVMTSAELARVLASHDALEQSHTVLESAKESLEQRCAALERQLEFFKRQLFGPKSEQRIGVFGRDPDQLCLGEGLAGSPASPPATASVPIAARERRRRGSRVPVDDPIRFEPWVPVETIAVPDPNVPASERDNYRVVGTKVTERLAQRPGSYVVLRFEREVLKRKDDGTFSCPPAPPAVIEGSFVDVSFLSGLVIDKLLYHLPLYRQHKRLEAAGVHIGRSTLTTYFQRVADLLEPIYDAQMRSVLESDVLAMDETPIKAGRKKRPPPLRGKMKTAYFWPIYGDRDEMVYPFAASRGHEVVPSTLKGFTGTLIADGYDAYAKYAERTAQVTLASCWSHVRREIVGAETAEPELTREALEKIRELYAIEERARKERLSGEALRAYRMTHSAPVVDAFFTFLTTALAERVLLPTSPFTVAANYAISRHSSLRVFLAHPGVALDTNHLERSLRTIAIGRNNWKFCWTEVGAKQVGILQSLLVTCQLHEVDPYTYLVDVLQRIDTHPASQIRRLTPRLWKKHFAVSPLPSALDIATGAASSPQTVSSRIP